MKKINNDILFKIAIILMPFENFYFAPSNGWATITPLIFVVYILFNFKYIIDCIKDYKKIICFFILSFFLSIINYFCVGANVGNTINAIISLGLGFVSLFSFSIYGKKNEKIDDVLKLLIISYSASLIIGIVEWITIKFNIKFIYYISEILSKRNYLQYNRVQFTYAEPSFIGMHLFGILLPIYFISKNKKILCLIIIYGLCSLIFNCSVRVILDIIIVATFCLVYYLIKNKKIKLLIILPLLLITSSFIAYNYNPRIKKIVNSGIYADGSLASRYFRINASVRGYIKNPINGIFGYGIGNSIIPLRQGYEEAKKEYKNSYMDEVTQLGDKTYNDDSVSYCIYIRFISEFGFILFVIAISYILKITIESNFKYKWLYLAVIAYIYIQFESYAFYSLWLFILVMIKTRKFKCEKNT